MLWLAFCVSIVLQATTVPSAAPLSLQIYSQGQQVNGDPTEILIEVSNSSGAVVEVWKAPIDSRQANEPPSSAKVDRNAPYTLRVVYESFRSDDQKVVDARGGHLTAFERIPIEPGQSVYIKEALSRYMLGARSRVWVEAGVGDATTRSNVLVFASDDQ